MLQRTTGWKRFTVLDPFDMYIPKASEEGVVTILEQIEECCAGCAALRFMDEDAHVVVAR